MKKEIFNDAVKKVMFHAGILVRGLGRTLYGTVIAGLIGFAVYGFVVIGKEGGYAAVFDFIASCALLFIALVNAYLLGSKKRGKKR